MKTNMNAALLRDVFAARATAQALVDCRTGRSYAYAELEDLSSRMAAQLAKTVRPGDRVVLQLPNSAEMILAYLACMQLGATSVPINVAFSPAEVATLLGLAAPAAVVTEASLPSLLASGPRLDPAAFPGIADDLLAHVVFSSGTTGTPKAIPIRLGRIIGHAAMFAASHGLGADARFYNVLPLAYLGGWYNLSLVPLLAGGTIVLDQEFGMRGMYRFWATCKEHRVNCLWFTPSMLSALAAIGVETDDAEAPHRQIRWAMVGMAPLLPALKAKFEALFHMRLRQSYGLSETFLFTSWMQDLGTPDDSVGRVLPGYELKLLADTAEIAVRGGWMMDGYWQKDAPVRAVTDPDGFFRTGDLGRVDAAGHVFITGRVKDLIIRGGVNIAPAEIENALLGFAGVLEAAVVGAEDELYGEKIVAFVTAVPGGAEPLDRKAILRHCRQALSAAKVPTEIRVIERMPLNASGKIQKAALKALLRQDAEP